MDSNQNQPSEVKEGGALALPEAVRKASEQVRKDAADSMRHSTTADGAARLMCRVDLKALALVLAHHDNLAARPPSMERGEAEGTGSLKTEMAARPEEQRRHRATPRTLDELRANAVAASAGKDIGVRWGRSHGCVIGGGHTIMFPAHGKYYVHPHKPDPANESNYARHAAGADPYTIIQLCDEIEYLRNLAAAPSPAPSAVEMAGVDREALTAACLRLVDEYPVSAFGTPEMPRYGSIAAIAKLLNCHSRDDAILALATASREKGSAS